MKPSAAAANSTTSTLPILGFWRDLEIFNIPGAPTAKDNSDQVKVVTLRPGDDLPWHRREFQATPQHSYIHVVYVGVADTEDLTRLLLQAMFPGQDLSERERQRASGNGWLAAFVATENGSAKADSYLASSFVHGLDAIRQSDPLDNINARLERARGEFAQRRHKLAEGTPPSSDPPSATAALTWTDLGDELRVVQRLLGEGASAPGIDWRVVVRVSRVNRRYLDDGLQAATDYLNSFYLDDLDRLISQARKNKPFGKALAGYLGSPVKEDARIDILEQHSTMGELVSVARLPASRWPAPAKFPLVLAQQAAVAQVLHTLARDSGAIGVNGPPGTGKTTLLCDVIAEVVTERARRLAALQRPVDIFDEKLDLAGKGFFPLKPALMAGTSIVVASSNNNAVKNISQELPARAKVSDEYGPVGYFDEVIREVFAAQKVLDEEGQPIACWGLIAAALGNAGNRRSFSKGFFRDEWQPRASANDDGSDDATGDEVQALPADSLPPSMKQVLEAASKEYSRYQGEWQAARRSFVGLLADFEARRAVLLQAEKAAQRVADCERKLMSKREAAQGLEDGITQAALALASQRDALAVQRSLVESRQATLAQLRAANLPNLWDRLVAWFGRESERMAAIRHALDTPTNALAQATEALAALAREIGLADVALKSQRDRLRTLRDEQRALEREHRGHQMTLQAGYDTGANHFPDPRFWAMPAAQRHRASMAVSPGLDSLRARIFLQAVELHRLTVLANAGKFIANLRVVNGMLTGALRDKLPLDQRPLVWDSFFFVVPVVSTTLASFDRLFAGMGQESMGWLLIDEAGQATPQSAAGAIWRSRRVVLIGDPLQIEPVFTVPLSLVEELRRRHGVAPMWSPADESVQTLADRITRFGSWVVQDSTQPGDTQRIWTGMPLRTHRRCDDPMFTVANQIAYAGQMVQGRVDAEGVPAPSAFSCVLGESAWFDVSAAAAQHPVVEDELAVLIDSLRTLQRQPAYTLPAKPAKVFVISPFRKVMQACKARIRKAGLSGIECGTVHTFQGKEAEVVFLVLGTAPGQVGAGARAWASGKPNLLNVAITRAKCRLYVIGNAQEWGRLNYFAALHDALPRRRPAPALGSSGRGVSSPSQDSTAANQARPV